MNHLHICIDNGTICGLCHKVADPTITRTFKHCVTAEILTHHYCSAVCKAESYEFQPDDVVVKYCEHCTIVEIPTNQRFCSHCTTATTAWLHQPLCECCLAVAVSAAEKYCDHCVEQILWALWLDQQEREAQQIAHHAVLAEDVQYSDYANGY